MDKVLWLNKLLWLIAAVLACVVLIGLAGLTTDTGSPSVQPGTGPAAVATTPAALPLQQNTSPTTVPVKTAYNRTLAAFWEFALEGPYAANLNWSAAVLYPDPLILYDINGAPLYYEFYLRNSNGIPGYFWTSADKRLGSGIFRIYDGAPAVSYPRITVEAEHAVRATSPGSQILSEKPGIYGSGYPYLCTFVTVQNTTNAMRETIVVDAYTNRIVPDRPMVGYPGYAESYLDAIPPGERPDRIARWDAEDARAEKIVAYALAHGIDPGLPLSAQNTSIIRKYYAVEPTGPTISPGDTPAQPGRGI